MSPTDAILVRVGIDSTSGRWNAPADPRTGEFVYVPIPEECVSKPGYGTNYLQVLPALTSFCGARLLDLDLALRYPVALREAATHLDPDFDHLTYGDNGARRASEIARLGRGDLLAFYAGLRSVVDQTLIYGLIGVLTVDEVIAVENVPNGHLHENAHTRRLSPSATEIVVRGMPGNSGRLSRYIPIGEWRDGAYRVRHDLLEEWGGLSVRNGFIQRSARPPRFLDSQRFCLWLDRQKISLEARNN